MICSSKSEFLSSLRLALENNHVVDSRDILTDFRQHFDDGAAAGETEAEVCRKLGDIDDIIKQYISEAADINSAKTAGAADDTTGADAPDASGFGAETGTQSAAPQYSAPQSNAPRGFEPSGGKIAGIICLDIFLYSWALPTLMSLIVALIAVTVSFTVSGLALLISGIFGSFIDLGGVLVTGFATLSLIFLGVFFLAVSGMLVIASIAAVKGYINLWIAIINQHANTFVGHKVANKIGKKYREAAV